MAARDSAAAVPTLVGDFTGDGRIDIISSDFANIFIAFVSCRVSISSSLSMARLPSSLSEAGELLISIASSWGGTNTVEVYGRASF